MKKISLLLSAACLLIHITADAQTFTAIDVQPGASASNPRGFTEFNGKVYFTATGDASTGSELWVTDGTQAGTSMVMDIAPGASGSNPGQFKMMGGKLFFSADDGVHGVELWATDGTQTGTSMVIDINAGIADGLPAYLTEMGGRLYFSANSATYGRELWVTDGTSAGTSLIKNIKPGTDGSDIAGFASRNGVLINSFNAYNGKLYFRADDGIHGNELWATDGTSAGTTMIADVWTGPGDGIPFLMTPLGGRIIFTGEDSLHGLELWTSDGTSAGTSLLKDIYPGPSGSHSGSISGFIELNGRLYFDATSQSGYELWSTDGTSAGTTLVRDIWAGPGSSRAGEEYTLTRYGNKIYFSAEDSLDGKQLWSSDGTTAGTTLVKVISTTTPYDASPRGLLVYNGQLIFTAEAGSSVGRELYTSDGTVSGTHVIAPAIAPTIDPLVMNINNIPLATANGDLYMNANFTNIGFEVWKYSAVGTAITEATYGSSISAYPNPFSEAINIRGLTGGESYLVEVLDVTGRNHYSSKLTNVSIDVSINMSDLSAGIYVVRVSGESSTQTFRIVKN